MVARTRESAMELSASAGQLILAGDDALDAVAPQDDEFVADELQALEEALVEGGIPNVEVKFALVVAMESGDVVADNLVGDLDHHSRKASG